MSLLLDTHVAIWSVADSPRLSQRARDLIVNEPGEVYVSAVSIWEIAIKWTLSRGEMRIPFSATDAIRHFSTTGYSLLDIRAAHAVVVESLPPLHGDPFDRLLLAQARSEGVALLTADEKLLQYGHGVMSV